MTIKPQGTRCPLAGRSLPRAAILLFTTLAVATSAHTALRGPAEQSNADAAVQAGPRVNAEAVSSEHALDRSLAGRAIAVAAAGAADNDAYASRTALPAASGSLLAAVGTATAEADEPGQVYGDPTQFRTRWYSFKPTTSGLLYLATSAPFGQTSFGPYVEIHLYTEGASVSALTEVGSATYCPLQYVYACTQLAFSSGAKYAIQLAYTGSATADLTRFKWATSGAGPRLWFVLVVCDA
jgi:hypothetical protein